MTEALPEDGLVLGGLTKVLGGRVIIDNLHLVVKKGEMVSPFGTFRLWQDDDIAHDRGISHPRQRRYFTERERRET